MNANDTIDELVQRHTVDWQQALKQESLKEALLPVERSGWPSGPSVDANLASQYPPIDLEAILGTLHAKRFGGIPAPRFAVYPAFGHGVCTLDVDVSSYATTVYGQSSGMSISFRRYEANLESKYRDIARRYAIVAALVWMVAAVLTSVVGALWMQSAMPLWGLVNVPLALLVFVSVDWTVDYWTDREVRLTAVFAGTIPADVRQTIRQVKDEFEQVLLVQEVTEWNAEVVRPADPLVVGKKGGAYYLVDRFDTTTYEEYVAREFTG